MIRFNPDVHHRRSIRLKGYDYTLAGAYFVTVCTNSQECLFGTIEDAEMQLNVVGRMIEQVWNQLPDRYSGVNIDAFVVMPNHIHGIVVLEGAGLGASPRTVEQEDAGQPRGVAPTPLSLADVVHRFKTLTTKRYTDGVKHLQWPAYRGRLWQRNYFEHVIRNEEELNRIRQYIKENPARWIEDPENPSTGS